jgi:1,4-alpha-glucan branching enzyme
MNFLPLDKLGARERRAHRGIIDFGVLLPGITPADGKLFVRIIHERDQFILGVPPVAMELTHGTLPGFGDFWTGSVDTNDRSLTVPQAQGWGATSGEQRYVYRFSLERPEGAPIDDIIDPFAREYGVGDLSAITVGYKPFNFEPAVENAFKVPAIKDAIFYELNVAELGGDVDKTIGLFDYLADLGVNVLEVMPVSNVAARIDWGYAPLGYFGVDERLGKRRDFQRLVAEAHRRGMAVIVDSVFGHVEDRFPYQKLYVGLGRSSPFVGAYAEDLFFQSTDFSRPLTQDFFFTVCVSWLENFRVDGFRYDAVSEYWDQGRPAGQQGFSDLSAAVQTHVDGKAADPTYQRFFPAGGGEHRLIQVAEFLTSSAPAQHVLFDTVANSAWQNGTMDAAKRCARGEAGAISELGHRLGLVDFPTERAQNGGTISKSALQYLENHDHERFICTFGTHFPDDDSARRGDRLLLVGDRQRQWFKVQPYLIGLLTGKGTPFLWQGQEICQDYFVPDEGIGRVAIYRPVDFNDFYDPIGKALIRLVRRLTRLRTAGAQFRSDDHFFYDDASFTNKGLLLFHRRLVKNGQTTFSLVALNFTDQEQSASFAFPISGDFVEELEGERNLPGCQAQVPQTITVPSNYGCVWTASG